MVRIKGDNSSLLRSKEIILHHCKDQGGKFFIIVRIKGDNSLSLLRPREIILHHS
jgi:hypothetical protein